MSTTGIAHAEQASDAHTDAERLAIRHELERVAARRARTRRHWRAALTGVALAAALLTGLQAYAAQGIADARQAALDRAHLQVSAPR